MQTRRQGTALFSALLFFVAVGVVVQLWLLWTAVDAALGHNFALLRPTAIASLVVLLINGGLTAFVFDFDRKLQGR